MDQATGPLSGRIALVTGAARGLGLHFAEALVEAGAKVALVARSADLLREHAERLGPSALAMPGDIADPDSVRAAFAATTEAFGGLDVLVNNATLNYAHRIEEATDAELQAEIGVNILGPIYCIREAVPLMRARGAGDIINVSSESVLRPFPFLATYAACKSAIETLTIGMRDEVRQDGIRMTTLRSGTVASGGAFLQGSDPERMRRFLEAAAAGGHLDHVGQAISPKVAAKALVDLLATPREAHIDMIAVRAI
jgi:meso-butanediol dehydrogenase / (S,S)-butanediol dehydrogenase / diacetyl reductase